MLDKLKSLLQEAPPAMAFEISEAGIAAAVRSLAGTQAARKRRDIALILPDFSARISVLDFDSFPKDPKEQASLVRFRLKRSVPFDVESAAMSYWAQNGEKGKTDVVA